MPSIDSPYGQPRAPRRPTTNRQVSGYNPQAYVPGGSTARVARAIQTKGGKRPAPYRPPAPAAAPRSRPAPAPPQATPKAAAAPAYDYDADPILQRIQGLTGRDRSFAQAEAAEAKKKLAIDYGDEDLARQLGDDNTARAAAGNPLGVKQQLRKGYDENVQGFENQLDSNLFYSGHRGNELGKLASGYQESLAGAGRQEQDLLSQIGRSLAEALMSADQRDAQAQAEAAQRAIESGLYGGDGLTGGTDGIAEALAAPAAGAAPFITDYGENDPDMLAALARRNRVSLGLPQGFF